MEVLVLILVIGLIPAMIAANKGRNFLLWYLYGCALFIIALVHALLLKRRRSDPGRHEGVSVGAGEGRLARTGSPAWRRLVWRHGSPHAVRGDLHSGRGVHPRDRGQRAARVARLIPPPPGATLGYGAYRFRMPVAAVQLDGLVRGLSSGRGA